MSWNVEVPAQTEVTQSGGWGSGTTNDAGGWGSSATEPAATSGWGSEPTGTSWGSGGGDNQFGSEVQDRGRGRGRGRGEGRGRGGGGGPRACFKCGQEGHMSRECPTGGGGQGGGSRACFKCGKEGHMSRECTEPGDGNRGRGRGRGRGGGYNSNNGEQQQQSSWGDKPADNGWGSTQEVKGETGGGWGSSTNDAPKQQQGWGSSTTEEPKPSGGGWGTETKVEQPASNGWGTSTEQPTTTTGGGWGSTTATETPATGGWGSNTNQTTTQDKPTGGWGSTEATTTNDAGGWGQSQTTSTQGWGSSTSNDAPPNDFRSGGGGDSYRGRGGGGRGGRGRGGGDSAGGGSRACFKCGQEGHMSRECPTGGGAPRGRGCFKCGKEGHMSRECTEAGGDQPPRRNGNCFKCQQPGHQSRDCPGGQSSGIGGGQGEWGGSNKGNGGGDWGSTDNANTGGGWGSTTATETTTQGSGWGNTQAVEAPQASGGWGNNSAAEITPQQASGGWGSTAVETPASGGWGSTATESTTAKGGWGDTATDQPTQPNAGWGNNNNASSSWGDSGNNNRERQSGRGREGRGRGGSFRGGARDMPPQKRVKQNPIEIVISDDEVIPPKKIKSPRFSDDEDEKVNEINAIIAQISSVPAQLSLQPLDEHPVIKKVQFAPLHNPEPDVDNAKTDNLWHLKRGLFPHDQNKKCKSIYTGLINFDADKVINCNLITFDNDNEFLDACPKVDLQLTPDDDVRNNFLTPSIKDHNIFKSQLIQLRSEERKQQIRRQYLGIVEGRDKEAQELINQIGQALVIENKAIRISYGIFYADITFFHINQIFGDLTEVPEQSLYSRDQGFLPSNIIFVVSIKPKLLTDMPKLRCIRKMALL